jgi:oligosaccharide repeat unit polymerase
MGWSDVFWLILFLGFMAAGGLISIRLYNSFVTPVFFFVSGNCLSIGLYHLRLLDYPDVSIKSHLVLVTSLIAFTLATLINGVRKIRDNENPVGRGVTPFFYLTSAFSTVGWVLPLMIMISKFSIPHLITNPYLFEYEFQMQFIGYLNVLGILVFPVFILKKYTVGARWFDVVLVILAFFGLFLAGIKSFMIYSLFGGVLAFSVINPRGIRIKHVALAGAIVIGFFVLYDQVIDTLGFRGFQGSSVPESIKFLERPYFYFSGVWPAVDQIVAYVEPNQPVTGFVVFQPFWKITADLLGVVEPIPRALPFVSIGPYDFNVYSFTGEVYWEWGPVGVLLFSACLGWLSSLLYRIARSSSFWLYKLAYAIFGYGVVISFFLYNFRFNMMFLGIYAVLMIGPMVVISDLFHKRDRST